MKDKVNAMVKYREPFRPFAPSILNEYVHQYFVNATPTPFMEKVYPIIEEKRHTIPAVTHVDGTGRLQTVTQDQNKKYWELIDEFRKLTGIPIVLNTSFNLKGEAIVCSPSDAIRTFFSSGLDALIVGSYLIEK
jgi:carbamoyltransferase